MTLDRHRILFCVAELVNVMADQAERTDWSLNHVQVGPAGEDAIVSLLIKPWTAVGSTDESLIRVDVQVRAYWVAGRKRPSDPDALPLRWATDPPAKEVSE